MTAYRLKIYDVSAMISSRHLGELFFLLAALCCLLESPSCIGQSSSSGSNSGILKGRVVVQNRDGSMFAPESAKVYLIYYHEPQKGDVGTAGDAYNAEQLKVVTAIAKQTSKDKQQIAQEPKEQRQDEFAKYYLQSVDQALTAAADWANKHNKSWQLRAASADAQGLWLGDGLRPGHYKIIARGKIGDLDAEWEAEANVDSGETISVSLTTIRMARRIRH